MFELGIRVCSIVWVVKFIHHRDNGLANYEYIDFHINTAFKCSDN